MEMETKRVTDDFRNRVTMISSTPDAIHSIMMRIEKLFEECDEELAKAEMQPLGYEKQPIETIIEHMMILRGYVYEAHTQCCNELDQPLFKGFANGATQILSEIILEEITTDNTFGMQEYVEVPETVGSWYMTEVKAKLTMADFLGLEDVKPGAGMPMLANVESIGWFTDLFRADYESMGASVESLDQMLKMYLYSGEYSHDEYHPIGNLISGILDVTIIKPFVESIYGKDLITGEKLTDLERGLQFVNAAVGAVTFGQGALALDFSKMTTKEIAVELVKIWGVDAIADASAFTAGYACDELGMPAGVSFLASMLTGCTVSVGVGGYVFTDSSGKVVKELDADEMQVLLKELDVDLDDMMWGGGKGTYKAVTDAYESLLGPMSDEDLKRYIKFLEDGSQAGLTPVEQMGIKNVDEYLALTKVDYDEVLALRKELLWTEEEKRYYKTLKNGSQAGLTPAEQFGLQKVDEQLLFNRIDYDEVLALRKGVSGEGNKTKLNYITSNGLELEATPEKTTTILGTYTSDTGAILDELGNVKSLDFGPRDGGFNLLNTPDELYISPDQFWNEYNKPWLDNAIAREDIFIIATEPTSENLTRINKITGKEELTGFGREYTYLEQHGYEYDPITKTMSKEELK